MASSVLLRVVHAQNSVHMQCFISSSCSLCKENLKRAKSFNPSSQKWLLRQINDIYVKKAKIEHYRCRSAFKLLEIQERYKLMRPGQTVVDLGCSPGSWTQVAVKATGATHPEANSVVLGIDLTPCYPVEGATLLGGLDFTSAATQQRLTEALQGRATDIVLSDMAPSTSGIKSLDHENIINLCYAALTFAQKSSNPGAALVLKVFDGRDTQKLTADCKSLYEGVRLVRPDASRKDSSELYLVCQRLKA